MIFMILVRKENIRMQLPVSNCNMVEIVTCVRDYEPLTSGTYSGVERTSTTLKGPKFSNAIARTKHGTKINS